MVKCTFSNDNNNATVEEGKQKIKFHSIKNDPIVTKDALILGQRLTSVGNKLLSY